MFLQLFKAPIYILIVALKFYALAKLLYRWNFPLSEIPGPKWASWSRLWLIRLISRSLIDKEMKSLHQRYGPIVRIAPNSILISDPEVTRKILAVGSKFERGPWFDSLRLDSSTTNVVSERDPEKHQRLRHILGPGLSGSDFRNIDSVIGSHLGELMRSIDHKIDAAGDLVAQVDLSEVMPLLTLDIMTQLCLGDTPEGYDCDRDNRDFLEALNSGMRIQPYIATVTEASAGLLWLGKIPWLRSLIFPNAYSSDGIGRLMRKIRKAVETRPTEGEQGTTEMLNSFMTRGLSKWQSLSELVIVMSSGSGSTAYAIQAIVKSILANPTVLEKLRIEIDDVVANSETKMSDKISNSVIRHMPYLQACIFEGLRLHPPVFSQLRERVVPPDGVMMNGYSIPGGTYVGFNSIGCQLDTVYGERVEEYVPERWIIDDQTKLRAMRRNLELVFGYGNSKCLGVNIANIELNLVVFELFRRYEMTIPDLSRPWRSRGDFVLAEFWLNLSPRQYMNNGSYA